MDLQNESTFLQISYMIPASLVKTLVNLEVVIRTVELTSLKVFYYY